MVSENIKSGWQAKPPENLRLYFSYSFDLQAIRNPCNQNLKWIYFLVVCLLVLQIII